MEWWVILGCATAAVRIADLMPNPERDFRWDVAGVACWSVTAILSLASGDLVDAVLQAAFAGVFAYYAWRNRPRNNRLADKVTGVVKNLGHRLAVVPVPAGGKS